MNLKEVYFGTNAELLYTTFLYSRPKSEDVASWLNATWDGFFVPKRENEKNPRKRRITSRSRERKKYVHSANSQLQIQRAEVA